MKDILNKLNISNNHHGTSTGLNWIGQEDREISSTSPVDGNIIGHVGITKDEEFKTVINSSKEAFKKWRLVPAPKRGEIVRQFGDELRKNKELLGCLVSYEMGKSYQEGLGEVQEMIDICDFAVGLSRQLSGITLHSERAQHRMYEQYLSLIHI